MSHGRSIAACILAAYLALACGAQTVSRAPQASPTLSGPIASDLPPGVCAPTYEQLLDPSATRIEAKLVTREAAMSNDPALAASSSNHFWEVAKAGQFTMNGPLPPGEVEPTLHYVVSLLQGSSDPTDPESAGRPCRGISITGSTTWPAWFDKMLALVDVKIR